MNSPFGKEEETSETGEGYWKYYHHLAHTQERDSIVSNIVSLVKENNNPPVKPKSTKRGRKPIHSWKKLVCICIIITIIVGSTFRDMQKQTMY
jgi:hypothetical protein